MLGATAASELTRTGMQSAVNTGQIAREAMNQSTRTVLESMRTAGVLTREKLREMANDAITSADELVAQFKADARAFKDSLKAGVIGNAVAANEWKKRRIIGTKAKTAKALARYEEGTTFGALEAGAVAFATAYSAIDYARFRSRTRKSVEKGSDEIRNQLKEVNRMLKLLEQFPRDTVGVEGTALADSLTAQLEELLYFSNAQLLKMGQMQADLPNSFVDDLANGMHTLGKGAEAVAGKLVELVKTGSAYSKAFAGEVAAGSLAVAALAVEDVLVPAVKTGANLAVRVPAAALTFGASEILPAMSRAEEANFLQRASEAMKKQSLGQPLSQLEQQALDGYRRRQGNE